MPHIYVPEFHEYHTPDGERFILHNPPRRMVFSDTGSGMPPIEYITQRGPTQHGVSLVAARLQPRVIQLSIRHMFCDRAHYWDGRADLLNIIRPNRLGILDGNIPTGFLRQYLSNGKTRQLDCLIQQGPAFAPRADGQWDEWAFNEVLQFIAFNPVEYDPKQHTQTLVTSSGAIVYPITYPITYGADSYSTTITYTGTWVEYPGIVLTGPMLNPVITHDDLDLKLALNYEIMPGETVTFDLTYAVKSVTSSLNGNIIGYLSLDSDLDEFSLVPAPQVTNGINNITVTAQSSGAASQVDFTWYERVIGY